MVLYGISTDKNVYTQKTIQSHQWLQTLDCKGYVMVHIKGPESGRFLGQWFT